MRVKINFIAIMFLALRDWWRTDRKEMVVSIITLVALFAMLYFGLWFMAIIEGRV